MVIKSPARALLSSGSYWLHKNYPYTQHSVMSVRSYHYLLTEQKTFPINIVFAMTISKTQGQTLKRVATYPPSPVFFPLVSSVWQLPCPLHLITSQLHLFDDIDNVYKMTDWYQTLYSRKCFKVSNININLCWLIILLFIRGNYSHG
jgi:hypothetical protein